MSCTLPVELRSGRLDRLSSELLVVPFFEGGRPLRGPAAQVDWRSCGLVSEQIGRGSIAGHAGEVLLHAKPDGATALVRGVEVPLPTLVPVAEGQPLDVVVKLEGHEERTVTIDGSTKKVAIELMPVASSTPTAVVPVPYTRKKKPKPAPVHGVVDPWEEK